MSLRTLASAGILLATVSIPPTLSAQGLNVSFGTGLFAFTGDELQGLDAGLGLEGRLAYSPSPKVSLGLGVTRVSSDIDVVDENVKTTLVYLEPRLAFPQPSGNLKPFVGARIGYARQTLEVEGTDASTSGLGFGPIGGLSIRLSPSISLDLTGSFTFLSFGDVSVEGDSVDDTDSSGGMMSLAAGITILLGGQR